MATDKFISPSRLMGAFDIQTQVTITDDNPDLFWLAGLLEGEGHFQSNPPNIVLRMTDRDVVERAMRVAGCGSLNGPFPVKAAHHNPIWGWKVSTSGNVLALALLLLPHMGARRAREIRKMISFAKDVRATLVKHGTRGQYKQGCRCDLCVDAQRTYIRTLATQPKVVPAVHKSCTPNEHDARDV